MYFFFAHSITFVSCFIADVFLSYPLGYKLYQVWKPEFPEGTKLIMSKQTAKKLREFDRNYRIQPVPRYADSRYDESRKADDNNDNEIQYSDTMYDSQHHIDKRDVHHKIAVCCDNDIQCVAMLCFARS